MRKLVIAKTIIENWEYHPTYGTDSRIITEIGMDGSCVNQAREYRDHVAVTVCTTSTK